MMLVQLWQEEGSPVWRKAQVPDRGGARLLVVKVRMRTHRSSKVWLLEEEEKRFTGGVGPIKTMEVVLSSPGQRRKMEVVMVTDMDTSRQTIRMRIVDGRSEKKKQVSRNVC